MEERKPVREGERERKVGRKGRAEGDDDKMEGGKEEQWKEEMKGE